MADEPWIRTKILEKARIAKVHSDDNVLRGDALRQAKYLRRVLITRILDYAKIVFRVIGKWLREHGKFHYEALSN